MGVCRWKMVLCLLLAPGLFGTTCGSPSSGFPKTQIWAQTTVNSGANVRPTCVQVFDFDNDGLLDVVAGYAGQNLTQPSVIIFFQTNPTTFTPVSIGTGSNLSGVAQLALSDLDNDGHRDVVAACNGQLVYLHSPADSRQSAQWTLSVINQSSGNGISQWNDVAIGTIDTQNGPDIVACNQNVGRVSWFQSPSANPTNGDNWTRIDIAATNRTGAAGVALDDFDINGRLDVISTAPGESTVRVAWFSNPADPVVGAWERFTVGNIPAATRVVTGDLNADGRTDVIVTNPVGRQVGWYIRPSDATSTWSGYLLAQYTADTPTDVRTADVMGTGQINVIVPTQAAGTLRWFSPFGAQTNQWIENNLRDFQDANVLRSAVGDINGDGRPDVIAPLQGTNTGLDQVAWFENPGF